MIFTDKGTEFKIVVNKAFKTRVKLFVQKVYKLETLPTNYVLARMFNVKISRTMSWLTIYAVTEDKLTKDEMTPNEVFYLDVQTACKKYKTTLGKCEFVGNPVLDIHSPDRLGKVRFIGRVRLFGIFGGGQIQIDFSKRGNWKTVSNIGHGLHQLLGVFQANVA